MKPDLKSPARLTPFSPKNLLNIIKELWFTAKDLPHANLESESETQLENEKSRLERLCM